MALSQSELDQLAAARDWYVGTKNDTYWQEQSKKSYDKIVDLNSKGLVSSNDMPMLSDYVKQNSVTARTLVNNIAQTGINNFSKIDPATAQQLYQAANQREQGIGGSSDPRIAQAAQDAMSGAENLASGKLAPEYANTAVQAISSDPLAQQALQQSLSQTKQIDTQQQQLGQFSNQLSQQYFGQGNQNMNLTQALGDTSGSLGQLNQFLGQQEGQTFQQQLQPLINMQLGAQGLQSSGANIELQSKALAGLEQSREQAMMQAALGAQQQVQGLNYSNLQGSIGANQQMLNNSFGLQQANITMMYQQQLEAQREKLAQQLASNNKGSSGSGGAIGMGLGTVLGGIAGGFASGGNPAGIMLGAGMGGSLGGGIGNTMSPNSNYGSYGGLPSTLSAGSSFFRPTGITNSTQNPNPYMGPMNNQGSNWGI